MTLFRKTNTYLVLAVVTALATPLARAAHSSAPAQVAPAVVYSRDGLPAAGVSSTSPAVATPVRYSTGFFDGSSPDSMTARVLVVPAAETNPETVARIAEDLTVMARIIEKNALSPYVSTRRGSLPLLGRLGAEGGMGPDMLFGSLGRPRPLYVGGYGAAFFLQVDFPLLPPAEKAQEPAAASQEDTVWIETRRSLREPGTGVVLPRSGPSVQPYSRDRVDGLRKSLVSTMKHATNIRGLEPAEWLTVVVQGVGFAAPTNGQVSTTDAAPRLAEQVMTLRVKKADVDAYAAGRLDESQFEQRMQLMTY